MRHAIAVVLASTAVAASCSPAANYVGPPWCDDFTVLMLEAQSVPSAHLVPCIETLPRGWDVSVADISDDGSYFWMNSTIAGFKAARIRLNSVCDMTGAVQVPTDEAGTDRYQRVASVTTGYEGKRIYTFQGGCVTIDFAFEPGASSSLANEVSLALGFVPRSLLNEAVRSATDGREQLDPVIDG